MGRPIKSKYFGTAKGQGTGGEGVLSVTITGGGATLTGTNTVVFSAPQLPGGSTAAGTVVLTSNTVTSVTITSAGSGYLSAPSVVFVSTTGTTATGTANLTSAVSNIIRGTAYLTTGSAQSVCDIDEHVSSKKYRVQNSEGVGVVRLVTTATLAAGQMNIQATDANTCTYWVRKLTARRAVLVQATATVHGFLFDSGEAAGWTLDAASAGVVQIDNH